MIISKIINVLYHMIINVLYHRAPRYNFGCWPVKEYCKIALPRARPEKREGGPNGGGAFRRPDIRGAWVVRMHKRSNYNIKHCFMHNIKQFHLNHVRLSAKQVFL